MAGFLHVAAHCMNLRLCIVFARTAAQKGEDAISCGSLIFALCVTAQLVIFEGLHRRCRRHERFPQWPCSPWSIMSRLDLLSPDHTKGTDFLGISTDG